MMCHVYVQIMVVVYEMLEETTFEELSERLLKEVTMAR